MKILELRGISLTIGGKSILQDVSWSIGKGEHWALLGENGSGKTTILKIVTGYLWPTKGDVHVLGKHFGEIDLRELRKSIGFVASAIHDRVPFNDSAIEVVLSGRYASIGLWEKPSAADVKRARGLIAFMECNGLEDRSFGTLSQGEQQRILIARALMPDPRLLILDEPCVSLDLAARERFLKTVSKLCRKKGLTLIYVTHHIEEIVPEVTHAVILKKGEVYAKGRKSKTLSSKKLGDALGVKIIVEEKDGRYWSRMVK
ncbi:MAG: ABC transporter ATP-binding protein [Candidatus Altiarchaeota archaeon]|nr:ABC transporter ATP-binding protein [Candidatus Altiarchaeota archaeon]